MIRFVMYDIVRIKRRVCANKRSGLTPRQRNRTKNMKVPSKLRNQALKLKCRNKGVSDKQIVSHQIGVATRRRKLVIENYLQKREYQLVCFFLRI
jgi:hypothetical protein